MKTKAKLILEFDMEITEDFRNSPANRTLIFNEIREDLPKGIEITKLLLFTAPHTNTNTEMEEAI